MQWIHDLSYFLGGAVLGNAAPHLVSGVLGQRFQTPFARPRGQGRSSSTVNVAWGFFNLVVAYLLIGRVGAFDPRATEDVVAVGAGALLIAMLMAHWFGRFNGGNTPN